jgi:hypothetical protein
MPVIIVDDEDDLSEIEVCDEISAEVPTVRLVISRSCLSLRNHH